MPRLTSHARHDRSAASPPHNSCLPFGGGHPWLLSRRCLGTGGAELYRFGPTPAPSTAEENATATINYTSGTTARPKGVQMTHRNLWINATVFAPRSKGAMLPPPRQRRRDLTGAFDK